MRLLSVQIPLAILLVCNFAGGKLSQPCMNRNVVEVRTSAPQTASEQQKLIDEAIKNGYLIRMVFFSGNTFIRDRTLRKKIWLDEGEVFTNDRLTRTLNNLSTLKFLEPVRITDVQVQLDRENKHIDLTIHVRDKRRSRRIVKSAAPPSSISPS